MMISNRSEAMDYSIHTTASIFDNRARKDYGYQAPQLEVPAHPDDVYSTPKKIREYRRVLTKIQPKLSPHSRRYLTKLDHGIMETLTANHILQNQVAEDRRARIDHEIAKRSKRIEKQEGQRVYNRY